MQGLITEVVRIWEGFGEGLGKVWERFGGRSRQGLSNSGSMCHRCKGAGGVSATRLTIYMVQFVNQKQNINGHMSVYILYPMKRFIAKRPPVNFFVRSNLRSSVVGSSFVRGGLSIDAQIFGRNFLFGENFSGDNFFAETFFGNIIFVEKCSGKAISAT